MIVLVSLSSIVSLQKHTRKESSVTISASDLAWLVQKLCVSVQLDQLELALLWFQEIIVSTQKE